MSDLDKELAAQREERAERLKMTFYNIWKIDRQGITPLNCPYQDALEDFATKALDRKLATRVLVMRTPDDELHVFADYNIMLFLFFSADSWLHRLVGLRDFWQLRRRGVPAVMFELEHRDPSDRDYISLTWVNYEGRDYSMKGYEIWPDRRGFVRACAAALDNPHR